MAVCGWFGCAEGEKSSCVGKSGITTGGSNEGVVVDTPYKNKRKKGREKRLDFCRHMTGQ